MLIPFLRPRSMIFRLGSLGFILVLGLAVGATAWAQTAEFTYQGKLAEGGNPANGNYDFEFRLFDAAVGGAALNGQLRPNVLVTNGQFTVHLDFGVGVFSGAARFLDISVKSSGGGGGPILLTPRQQVLSVPYAIKALNAGQADTANNATQLGGVAANQFVQTNDPRLSGNAILNQTVLQAGANFNIGGNGTADAFNALTEYDLGGKRFISAPLVNNVFIGINAGKSNTNGTFDTFVGFNAGTQNTTGIGNTFIGDQPGASNITGSYNTFVGGLAGFSNTADNNSFFGSTAGLNNTTGSNNAFFGKDAGRANTIGAFNSFFGFNAGTHTN